jgi:hypothetical protein
MRLTYERASAIRKDYHTQKQSIPVLAKKYNLSTRHIYRILDYQVCKPENEIDRVRSELLALAKTKYVDALKEVLHLSQAKIAEGTLLK